MKKAILIFTALAFAGCSQNTYTAGTYVGTGEGHGGSIVVEVTVTEKIISTILITENPESGFSLAPMNAVVESVLKSNSADVDTISGATESSTGIRNAIQNALKKAELE